MLNRLRDHLKYCNQEKNSWLKSEYFDDVWKERIQKMAFYISPNSTVMDLGCGLEWLKDFLPDNCVYYGCDYKKRNENTILCNFNKKQFPDLDVDVCFVSGCLEYIFDYKWFISRISAISNTCIISYCTTDFFPSPRERGKHHWVNSLKKADIIEIFERSGFNLVAQDITKTRNTIFLFRK
jgi:hypothetical protein